MTIRLPAARYGRLRQLVRTRGVRVDEVIEDLAPRELSEIGMGARFRMQAVRGDSGKAPHHLDWQVARTASKASGSQT